MEAIEAPVKLSSEAYFLPAAGAVVTTTNSNSTELGSNKQYLRIIDQPFGVSSFGYYAKWGADNLLPNTMIKLIYENDLKPQLINKRVNFNCGNGVIQYTESEIDSTTGRKLKKYIEDPTIKAWLDFNEYNDLNRSVSLDLESFGNCFLEFVLTNGGQVYSVMKHDASHVRCELINQATGRVENFFINPDWRGLRPGWTETVPSFDPANPTKYKKFILHIKQCISGYPYYSPALWIGSQDATEVANTVWKFHKSGLKNGYAIRWHIQIPESYFAQFGPDVKNVEKAKDDVRQSMNQWLAGADNAGKAFVSFLRTINGSNLEEWKITPINADLKDTAFNALFDQTTIVNSRSHGIHPILGGIQLSGRLGSGSEIWTLYHAHIAVETPAPRALLNKPLKLISKMNGWDPQIKFGIDDIDLGSLATAPNDIIPQLPNNDNVAS
jgi:hypothetical protein